MDDAGEGVRYTRFDAEAPNEKSIGEALSCNSLAQTPSLLLLAGLLEARVEANIRIGAGDISRR
jgi:hypothetical protein